MKAGVAQSGRTILAALTAALMIMSMMFVLAAPADADHIDDTGTVQANCVEFQAGEVGSKSPDDYQSVVITLVSWDDSQDPHEVDFTISGLAAGQYVDISVKSGNDVVEDGPYGNGSHTYTSHDQQAISHIRLCVFEETPPTTTPPTTTPPTTTPPTTTPPTTTPPTTTPPTTTPPTTTPPTTAPPAEVGEIIVEKVVIGDASQTFEFTFDTGGFTLGDNTLAHGQSSSSGPVAVGDGYSVSEVVPAGWTLVSGVCDDGSDPSNIDVAADETVTCTFTNTIQAEVQASIVVNVDGTCEVNEDDEGEGIIDVDISVDDGAEVVISDSDGDVIETLTSSGTVTVPEGATYSWEATPNEGFEFPEGSETSGTITIETCSAPETLPFTGVDSGMMAVLASALLAGGLVLISTVGREEES